MNPNAPERIWLTREDTGASWSGSFRVFRACDLEHEDCPEYAPADLLDAAQDRIAALEAALKPFADIGIGSDPEYQPMIRMDRAAILAARAAIQGEAQ